MINGEISYWFLAGITVGMLLMQWLLYTIADKSSDKHKSEQGYSLPDYARIEWNLGYFPKLGGFHFVFGAALLLFIFLTRVGYALSVTLFSIFSFASALLLVYIFYLFTARVKFLGKNKYLAPAIIAYALSFAYHLYIALVFLSVMNITYGGFGGF